MEGNRLGPGANLTWRLEYTFTSFYGLEGGRLTAEAWGAAVERMKTNWTAFDRHNQLRTRLYTGPPSASGYPGTGRTVAQGPCRNLACAQPTICALLFADGDAAKACAEQATAAAEAAAAVVVATSL